MCFLNAEQLGGAAKRLKHKSDMITISFKKSTSQFLGPGALEAWSCAEPTAKAQAVSPCDEHALS